MTDNLTRVLAIQQNILEALQSSIRIVDTPEYAHYVNFADSYQRPIQRWMRYREGFSPPLVTSLLQSAYQAGGVVADLFCGSGTTLFVASRMGCPSVGVDSNPVAAFATRVKTEVYTDEDIQRFEQAAKDLFAAPIFRPSLPKPDLKIIDKIFSPHILERLLMYKEIILQQRRALGSTKEKNGTTAHNHEAQVKEKILDLLFLGWMAILEGVSNTYKEGNGIKYRKSQANVSASLLPGFEHTFLQYRSSAASITSVELALVEQYQVMLDDLRADRSECGDRPMYRPLVFCGSALELDQFMAPESVSCVITSPPYPNCFDYTSIFKVELWMGDFVQNYPDMNALRHRSIRSHANARLSATRLQGATSTRHVALDEPTIVDRLIALMDESTLWDKSIPKVVRGYFEDMETVLAQIQRVLMSGGMCMMVVGSSAYSNVIFPTDLLLAEAAPRVGLQVERIEVARHLTTSSQQKKQVESLSKFLRESVLVFRKL